VGYALTVPERTERIVPSDLNIRILGPCRYPSPLSHRLAQEAVSFVGQADRVFLDDRLSSWPSTQNLAERASFELAGPRNRVFHDVTTLRAGIVTCGGLCPGLNNVVQGLVLQLWRGYGVREIFGYRHGYEGLVLPEPPVRLTPDSVSGIHWVGGTVLGSSRGNREPQAIVDRLVADGIRLLFVVGGDGTLRGAMTIVDEVTRRSLPISVIGVPKTIDNDIHFIDRSFGFETAFTAAVDVLRSAHVEATGARNGIGVVKVMGRHSGFIACHSAIASTEVDAVLVPEVPLALEGPNGLFQFLENKLAAQSHALMVVAEGAGQELIESPDLASTDASGNARLGDIGLVLCERIKRYFSTRSLDVTLKYIDPSYHIRSVPASPNDSLYCWQLARNAVHAAMAGNTEMLVGRWHGRFVHVPMPLATRFRKQVDTHGDLWTAVLESTGQPQTWG
jgi:6-phosphofructokinase 1